MWRITSLSTVFLQKESTKIIFIQYYCIVYINIDKNNI